MGPGESSPASIDSAGSGSLFAQALAESTRRGAFAAERCEFRPYNAEGRGDRRRARQTTRSRRPLRSTGLCRTFTTIFTLLAAIHTMSCGLFFCVQIPGNEGYGSFRMVLPFAVPSDDSLFRQEQTGAGDYGTAANASAVLEMRIPRVVHQTYRSRGELPKAVDPLMASWQKLNPGWEIMFYDDEACNAFVRAEFPEYEQAYRNLPKNVERSDFFRYMVVLRFGGVYADIDTECKAPLDTYIRPSDSMVVGWEAEVATDREAFNRHFVRKRQVLQWVFAAEPGHPVLRDLCDHIAGNYRTRFSNNTNRDTLERTGPGVWTDVVLRYATRGGNYPWKVRVLPRVAFGVHPAGLDGVTMDATGILVQHHFLGSWKKLGGWQKGNVVTRTLKRLRTGQDDPAEVNSIKESGVSWFPVSVSFSPPFVMMVNLKGRGDREYNVDVGAEISAWGQWQAGLDVTRQPRVVDALVGSLDRKGANLGMVDIGAGLGFFSLAAAARGHRVVAFETSSTNLAALKESVQYNKFESEVDVKSVVLGSRREPPCEGRGGPNVSPVDGGGWFVGRVHNRRTMSSDCVHGAALSDHLPGDIIIGAMRISAGGRTGWVVEGSMDVIQRHMPNIIAMEFVPRAMQQLGYENQVNVLWMLHDLGYVEMFHAGHVCDLRWMEVTKTVRRKGIFSAEMQPYLSQGTWCTLKPESFDLIIKKAHYSLPENLLFVYRGGSADVAG